jgi:hypothetical protein
MTGAGIADGDLVVIRQQSVAESGEIVAAAVTARWRPRLRGCRGRACVADATEPCLRADNRRRRHHLGQGRCCAALPGVTAWLSGRRDILGNGLSAGCNEVCLPGTRASMATVRSLRRRTRRCGGHWSAGLADAAVESTNGRRRSAITVQAR